MPGMVARRCEGEPMVGSGGVRILVVCTGNVCRSPYIERRLQAALDESWGVRRVHVESAGTLALTGWPMEPAAEVRLVNAGGTATGFVARDLTRELIERADLIITATREHRSKVVQADPKALRRTHALADLAQLCSGRDGLPTVESRRNQAPEGWFSVVIPWLAQRRGLLPPLPETESRITDPYGRDDAAFDAMAADIEAALPAVLSVLGRPRP